MGSSKQNRTNNPHHAKSSNKGNLEEKSLAISNLSGREENFLLAQYNSLREEVLKRIELQHQLILGTLVALGTMLTVSTQPGSLSILLVYPVLAMFLTLAWSQNDTRNRQITRYIDQNEVIFLNDPSIGWEHSHTSSRLWRFGSRKVFAARGIFVGSQILTVLLFWLNSQGQNRITSTEELILIITDIIVIAFTVLIIGFPSRTTHTKPQS